MEMSEMLKTMMKNGGMNGNMSPENMMMTLLPTLLENSKKENATPPPASPGHDRNVAMTINKLYNE